MVHDQWRRSGSGEVDQRRRSLDASSGLGDGVSSIVNALVAFCTHVIATFGIPGVFGLMTLESACIPVPSEAIMLFAGFSVSQGHMAFAAAVAAGVAGNVVGSWAAYAAGYYGGRPFIDRWGRYILLNLSLIHISEPTRLGMISY